MLKQVTGLLVALCGLALIHVQTVAETPLEGGFAAAWIIASVALFVMGVFTFIVGMCEK